MSKTKSFDTRQMVLLALLTAIVVVLQFLGAFIRFGPFSISLVLMPIAVGAALIGLWAGAWLGLVFGFVVLLSGDAAVFMAIDPLGTILVVLVKGSLAGFSAGAIYKVMEKTNKTKAALSAAAVCPIVNTAVFIIGTYAFFLPTITEWAAAAGFASATAFIFIGMIGLNFIVELILNFVLSPVIIRLVQFGRDRAANAG